MTNGRVCATIVNAATIPPSERPRLVASRPALNLGGVTSRQNCDGPQPPEAGQASKQATDVGQVNAGRSTQRGQIGGNAPATGAIVFSSHAPDRTTGVNTAS